MQLLQFKHINQYIIINDDGSITFQSYDSIIATVKDKTVITLNFKDKKPLWDYSNTTRKHFKLFVNEYTAYKYIDKTQFIKLIKENENIKELK